MFENKYFTGTLIMLKSQWSYAATFKILRIYNDKIKLIVLISTINKFVSQDILNQRTCLPYS